MKTRTAHLTRKNLKPFVSRTLQATAAAMDRIVAADTDHVMPDVAAPTGAIVCTVAGRAIVVRDTDTDAPAMVTIAVVLPVVDTTDVATAVAPMATATVAAATVAITVDMAITATGQR